MKSSCLYPLEGEVYVNEFYVGGEEEKNEGVRKTRRQLVPVALEVLPGKGVGRA